MPRNERKSTIAQNCVQSFRGGTVIAAHLNARSPRRSGSPVDERCRLIDGMECWIFPVRDAEGEAASVQAAARPRRIRLVPFADALP